MPLQLSLRMPLQLSLRMPLQLSLRMPFQLSLRVALQLSLRGAKRRGNLQHYDPVRLPRRFAPRNDVILCSINACLFDVRLFIFPDIVDSCGNRYNDDKGVHY
ncbi:MAG: hypothetical protein E7113_00985 [Bacteroidales bacterium]|nr:hypothetical protein [Bacteroidales bacterium]